MPKVNVHLVTERQSPYIEIVEVKSPCISISWSYWTKRHILLQRINRRVIGGEITKAEAYDMYLNWQNRRRINNG